MSNRRSNISWMIPPLGRRMVDNPIGSDPARVANTLRRMHARKDPQRFSYMAELQAILDLETTEEQWNAFISSGLPLVLMDIVSDKRIYARGTGHAERGLEIYLISALTSLIEFLCYFSERDPSNSCARQLLRKTPALCNVLWPKRVIIFSNEAVTSNPDLLAYSRDLVFIFTKALIDLHKHCYETLPPLTDRSAHVMLYCWTVSNGTSFKDIIWTTLVQLLSANESSAERFFRDVIISNGLAETFTRRSSTDLVQKDMQDMDLLACLEVLTAITRQCTTLWETREDENTGEVDSLMRAISISCQRQACSGDEDILPHTLQVAFKLADHHIDSLGHGVITENADARIPVPDTLALVALAPRALRFAVAKRNSEYYNHVKQFLKLYGILVHRFEVWGLYKDLSRIVRKVWLPTLKALRDFNLNESDPFHAAITEWIKFGSNFGLSEAHLGLESDPVGGDNLGDNEKQESDAHPDGCHCHWQDCLCYGRNKPIHKMRVCKGCLKVYYCNPRCQKRDWKEGGHKEVCRGRAVESVGNDAEDVQRSTSSLSSS